MKNLFIVLATFLFCAQASIANAYSGPKQPIVPADQDPIVATITQCAKDAGDVMGGDPLDANDQMTKNLCAIRTQHIQARSRLLADLARLVSTFDGVTNHDHDQNLPLTIQSAQTLVATCLTGLESQQYPHNIELVMQPERNAVFCDNQASALIEAIIGQ
jgi:hypothetical protein